MATLQGLQARIAKLQAQAEAIAKKESSTVLAKIHELLERHGLTTADVDAFRGTNGKPSAGSADTSRKHAGAAKYADPKTGATWTGHGRAPAWIASAKDRSRFLIDSDTVVTPSTAKKEAKAGNYVRGPQEPKYRDPQSGATWSGRGKAPAWLASAADRTAFLINASGAASSESTKPAAKKATAKKVAPKKAAAKKTAAKKTASKKIAPKKSAVKSAPAAKKASAKSAVEQKAPAKKPAAKRAVAKKGSSKAEGESQAQALVQQGGEASAPVAE